MQLNDKQKQAVEYTEKPLIISASAGSGKTRTLTEKFSYLCQNGYNKSRILAVTFTNKASNELKERVSQTINCKYFDLHWVRTIHSMSIMMIKPFLKQIGFKDNYTIYTSYEQKKILKKIIKNYGVDPTIIWEIIKAISFAKNHFDPINTLENYEILGIDCLVDVFNDYVFYLKDNNAFDYDDLLWFNWYLLQNNEEYREYYQNLFQYILVDEFQDVNLIQNEIFKILVNDKPKISVVGDVNQSVYSFRLANPEHFINFTKNKNIKVIKLARNYRSSNNIVETSNYLISNNSNQIGKPAYSEIKNNIQPVITQYKNETEESNKIAKQCIEYVKHNKDINYKDIAILYRVKYMSRSIEQDLVNMSIPYQVIGNVQFFERREIKDLMSYLYFINNYNDVVSFERLCQSPKKGIGQKTIEDLLKCPGEDILDKCLYATKFGIFSKRITSSLRNIINLTVFKKSTPDKILKEIVNKFDFKKYMELISSDQEEFLDRNENIKELISYAKKTKNLSDFIEEISLMNNQSDETLNKVSLMTMHASKGLEFKVVFIIGCEFGILPHFLAHKSDEKNKNKKGLEEERRLFYVGITRSEKYLHISHCKLRAEKMKYPSPFIKEIRGSCFDQEKADRKARISQLGGNNKNIKPIYKGSVKDRIKELLCPTT